MCNKKKNISLLFAFLLSVTYALGQEKLLYNDNFQGWDAVTSSATESFVTKKTFFSNETIEFKLKNVEVNPTGTNGTKFNLALVSTGWIMCAKTSDAYIELSPLKSVTRIEFIEGATGGSRGYKVWKKAKGDTDWVEIYSTFANPAAGVLVSLPVNGEDVALKFTNLAPAQNAYLFDLRIWGNYVPQAEQVVLSTSLTPDGSGVITRTPQADTYDKGAVVQVNANPNFGYRFLKWVDASGATVSDKRDLSVEMTNPVTLQAVFEKQIMHEVNFTTKGSRWGKVTLSPEPQNNLLPEGTILTLTVQPREVCTFQYWDDMSSELTRQIVIDAPKTISATFEEKNFVVGWDFADQTTKQSKAAEFYSNSENQGILSLYKQEGTKVNWLSNLGSFSPLLPCARMWTAETAFTSERRYFETSFSTKGLQNVRVNSLVSGNYQVYTIIKMQYSVDGVNYIDLKQVDITNAYNTSWLNCDAQLPQEAWDKESVRVRWSGDVSSPVMGTGNDGTALTNVYVYADPVLVDDGQAPVLISSVPVQQSATASSSGTIVLTFDEKVKPGPGSVSLDGVQLTPIAGSNSITYRYNRLNYNTTYTLVVPGNAVTDLAGNPFEGMSLTFKTMNRPQPVAKLFDAVVATDGSGDFLTVQEAIDAAPSGCTAPYLIFIKSGKYKGHVNVPQTKPFIHLIGEDSARVVLTDNRLCGDDGLGTPVYHVSLGATLVVNGNDFYAENISFVNSYGVDKQAGPQALALYTEADRVILKNCRLLSFQDTYLTSYVVATNRHYLENCYIEGAVDYIYGGSDVFFERCTLYNKRAGGYIVAPSHMVGTAWGYIFNRCVIDGTADTNGTIWLGRPWQNAPRATFLHTTCNIAFRPEAWYEKMGAIPHTFADYGTMDRNGNLIDRSQRNSYFWYMNGMTKVEGQSKSQLTDLEAANVTVDKVLSGSDNWMPQAKTERIEAPAQVEMNGTTLKWNGSDYAICYVVLQNDSVIGFTKSTSMEIKAKGNDRFGVKAVSETGSLSVPNYVSVATTVATTQTGTPVVYTSNGEIIVRTSEGGTVELFNLNGQLILSKQLVQSVSSFPISGLTLVKVTQNNRCYKYKLNP